MIEMVEINSFRDFEGNEPILLQTMVPSLQSIKFHCWDRTFYTWKYRNRIISIDKIKENDFRLKSILSFLTTNDVHKGLGYKARSREYHVCSCLETTLTTLTFVQHQISISAEMERG
jgi:hypothetical protein